PFCRAPATAGGARHRLPPRSPPGARPGLLHLDRLRVPSWRARCPKCLARRRPLQRAGPIAGRAGIGFALGEDRFVLAMQAAAVARKIAPESRLAALLVPLTQAELAPALELAERLRRSGVRLDLAAPGRKLGKSLELAGKLGAAAAVIIGADEASSHHWQVKNLATGAQVKVAD